MLFTWDEILVLVTVILIFVTFFVSFIIMIKLIKREVTARYNNLWQYIYDNNIKPGLSLPIDEFKPIYLRHLKSIYTNRLYQYRNDLYRLIYKALRSTADLLLSETIDDIRISFGHWMNKEILARYVNASIRPAGPRPIILKLTSLNVTGDIASAEIYHIGLNKAEIAHLVRKGLDGYQSELGDKVHIKPLRRNYSLVIFPV